MVDIDSEDCLYMLAYECENLLEQLQDAPMKINTDLCAEFQQQFAIWSSNLGVFARKSQCLDTRLRNFPDLQDLVARLLDILRRNLQQCMIRIRHPDQGDPGLTVFESQHNPDRAQSAALITIEDTLTRLNRLGVRIRQSTRSKIDARIQKFTANVDLEPFEYLCSFAVQILYPDAHQSLKDYLGKSMAKRYATMLFINSRQKTLKTRREPLLSIPEVPDGETQTGAPVNRLVRVIDNSIRSSFLAMHTTLSQSDLSSVNIQEIRNRSKPPDEASTRRYKTSSIQINQTNYPRPPVAERGSNNTLTCPWCAKLLSNTLSESQWRRHVDEDFKPYICLSEKCPESHPTYSTFNDWLKHMRLHSRRWHEQFYLSSSWVCTVCTVNSEVYSSPHALHSHMKESHSDDFTNEQLEVISRQSKLDQPRAGHDCLLCCFVIGGQENPGFVALPKRPKGELEPEAVKVSRKAPEMASPGPHLQHYPDTSSDSDNSGTSLNQAKQKEGCPEPVARHIAAHLQTLMFLTLRFADLQNYNGGLDDDIKSDSVEVEEGNGSLESNDVARLSDFASEQLVEMSQGEDIMLVPDDNNFDEKGDSNTTGWEFVSPKWGNKSPPGLSTTSGKTPQHDGLNDYRTARVAEIISDFRTLQYSIAAAPREPLESEDYYTEGWATLRQCTIDGRYILDCAADIDVPRASGGEEEQAKAELKQILLDAYARRHEAQKIHLRQAAAQRWLEYRKTILQGERPSSSNMRQLRTCDEQLRSELSQINNETVYPDMQASDVAMGRWTAEDPTLQAVRRWVQTRPQKPEAVSVYRTNDNIESSSASYLQPKGLVQP